MKTLILDSATKLLYTALIDEKTVLYESYIKGQNDHAKSIFVEIEKACTQAKINLADVDRVIVGVGPGSYTGVRMAVTVGKMMATMGKNIDLYQISTLLLMASGKHGIIESTIDARHGNCFGCIYDMDQKTYLHREELVEKTVLDAYEVTDKVTEEDFQVDPFVVVKLAAFVEEPHLLVPNYLRETEAERKFK